MRKKKQTSKRSETDLYQPIYDYLTAQGYTVRSEVLHCDIAATKNDELIIIELKLSLNLTLLAQAVVRQRVSDAVYVAIPRPSNMSKWENQCKDVMLILKRLELGLILVSHRKDRPSVDIVFHPLPYRRQKKHSKIRAIIKEMENRSGDYNTAGCTRTKLVTSYREKAIEIACCLADHQVPMSTKDIRKTVSGKNIQSILYNNFYGWFERSGVGIYGLTIQGKAEIENYPELLELFDGKK